MKAGPGSGGPRPGAGRPPSWLREKCQKIVEKEKLVEFLADVAAGRIQDHKVIDGEVIEIPASIYDRRECALALLDRGYGKPVQMLDTPFGGDLARMLLIREKELEIQNGRNGNGVPA